MVAVAIAVVLIHVVQSVGLLVVQIFVHGGLAGIVTVAVLINVYHLFVVVALLFV